MKDFRTDFFKLINKLKNNEPFAFGRFSDGELRILQNKNLVLASDKIIIGDSVTKGGYRAQDHKEFIAERDSFYQKKLVESFQFKKDNYFKGLSCKCCVGEEDFNWQINLHGGDDDSLTWANLWVNANYPLFREHFVPEMSNHKIVYVCNEVAKLEGLPFKVVKDFRVGYNCIINNYDIIETIKNWITENDINNYVFLFSASSLSNFCIHQLFEFRDTNWYIDVGTCLNPYIGMDIARGYLINYAQGKLKNGTLGKVCVW